MSGVISFECFISTVYNIICFSRYPNDLSALSEHDEAENQLTLAVPEPHMIQNGDVSGKKKVETKDASNGVRMFCKHCGHPIDVDD